LSTALAQPASSQISITRDDSGTATGDESRIYFADFSRLLYGEDGGLRIDVSREASYNVSGTAVHAFQRDQTVVRLISSHDFAAKYRGMAISIIKAVDWA
jgi:HK97 family phage major capsid protein